MKNRFHKSLPESLATWCCIHEEGGAGRATLQRSLLLWKWLGWRLQPPRWCNVPRNPSPCPLPARRGEGGRRPGEGFLGSVALPLEIVCFMSRRELLAFGFDHFQRRFDGVVFEVQGGAKADRALATAQHKQAQFISAAPKLIALGPSGQIEG